MSQKKKALEAVRGLGFEFTTVYNPQEIQEVLVAAAAALSPRGLKFGLSQAGVKQSASQLVSIWVLKDLIRSRTLNFQVIVTQSQLKKDNFDVKMEIGQFEYVKGSWFFMKPQIVGEPLMQRFKRIVTTELSAPQK